MANLSAYNLLIGIDDNSLDFLAFVLNELNSRSTSHFSFTDPYEAGHVVREMALSDPSTFAHYVGLYIADCVLKNKINGDVAERMNAWQQGIRGALDNKEDGTDEKA